jgi:hypothetical protein
VSLDYRSLLLPLAILLAFAVAVVAAARRRSPRAWVGALLVGVAVLAALMLVATSRMWADLPSDIRTRIVTALLMLYGLPVAAGTAVAIALSRARPRVGWHLAAVLVAALLTVPVGMRASREFDMINAVQ